MGFCTIARKNKNQLASISARLYTYVLWWAEGGSGTYAAWLLEEIGHYCEIDEVTKRISFFITFVQGLIMVGTEYSFAYML
jgi:hypothetical protein